MEEPENIESNRINVICAWCGVPLYKNSELPKKLVSHGICKECSEKMIKDLEQFKPA